VGTAGFGVEVGWGVPVGTGVTVSVGNGVFVTVGVGVGVKVLVGVGVGVQSGVNVKVGTRVRVGGNCLVGATDTNSTAPQAVPTIRTRTAIINVMLRRLTVIVSPPCVIYIPDRSGTRGGTGLLYHKVWFLFNCIHVNVVEQADLLNSNAL